MNLTESQITERKDLLISVYNKFQKLPKDDFIIEDLKETKTIQDQEVFKSAIQWIKKLKDCPRNISAAIFEYIKIKDLQKHKQDKALEITSSSISYARFTALANTALSWPGWNNAKISYKEFWNEVQKEWESCYTEEQRVNCVEWAENRYKQIVLGEI